MRTFAAFCIIGLDKLEQAHLESMIYKIARVTRTECEFRKYPNHKPNRRNVEVILREIIIAPAIYDPYNSHKVLKDAIIVPPLKADILSAFLDAVLGHQGISHIRALARIFQPLLSPAAACAAPPRQTLRPVPPWTAVGEDLDIAAGD